MSLFESRWAAIANFCKLPPKIAEDTGRHLALLYGAQQRSYHGKGHVESMLRRIELLKGHFANAYEAELAAYFHDAILTPGAYDNEERSMFFMMQAMQYSSLTPNTFSHSARMILATKTHTRTHDAEVDLFIDIDKEVLGLPWSDYLAYAQGIWREYSPRVGNGVYREKRVEKFINPTLAAESVFLTPHFDHLNQRAHDNLLREKALLEGPLPLRQALEIRR